MSVLLLLRAAQSSEASERTHAEHQASEYAITQPHDFFAALFDAAGRAGMISDDVGASSTISVSDGQAALLVLKMIVVRHWSPGFEQYTGHPLSHDARAYVRARLLELVAATPQNLVRAAAAMVIARIGSLEYPDQWPGLVQQTVHMLSDSVTLRGGLVLLRELISDTMQENDFFEVGPYILERLLQVAQSHDAGESRVYAIQCFRQCITFLLMGDDDELDKLYALAEQHIPPWINVLCQLIREIPENYTLQSEIIDTIREVDNAFDKVLEPYMPAIVASIVATLEGYNSEDGDAELAANQTDVLDSFMRSSPSVRDLVFTAEPGTLNRLSSLLLKLAELPEELVERWSDDVNEFVSFETEMSTEVWPRQSVGTLVGVTGQPALFSTLLSRAQTAQTWSQLEAALYLIGNVLLQVDISKTDATSESLETLAAITSRAQGHPLLEARCVITQGLLAKYTTLPMRLQFLLDALQSRELPVPGVVIAARIKTVGMGCALFSRDLAPHQSEALELISTLVESAADDTPVFLVENFLSVLRLNFAQAVAYDGVFQMFFALASKDTADVDLNTQIIELVGDMLDHTADSPVLTVRIVEKLLVPVLQITEAARATNFEYSSDLNFALELAAAVLERDQIVLPEERERLLAVFYEIVTTTQDPQVLQAGSFAYAALVAHLRQDSGMISVSHETAQNILQVAARLLDPELDDSAALASGKLVTAIVDQFNDAGTVVSQVLTAAAQRLSAAENALLIEGLILVFCELVLRNAPAVVELLAGVNLLEATMRKWVATFEVVRGADEIHKNIRAFQILYDLHDVRLDAIEVDDKPIIDPNVILTRSRARNLQFIKIPLPLKIIKLLVHELAQAPPDPAGEAARGPSVEADDDDDEWDDELAVGIDGSLVDRRNFRLIRDWFRRVGQQGMQWYPKLTSSERNTLMEASKGGP